MSPFFATAFFDFLATAGGGRRNLQVCLLVCGAFLQTPQARGGEVEPTASDEVREAKEAAAREMRARQRESQMRASEREFTNRDFNGNFQIDEEEWKGLLEEHRTIVASANLSSQTFGRIDADRDGTLAEGEVDAWIRTAFEKKIKLYVSSEIFKQRKSEYEKSK